VLIEADGGLIAGHGRILAAQKLGIKDVPCMIAEGWTEAQKKAYIIADNKLALNAGWDDAMLKVELGELDALDFDLSLTGFSEDELTAFEMADEALPGEGDNEGSTASLADKFGIAPFSVLNAREGWWQNRKRAWLALGIKSEVGREGLAPTSVPKDLPEGHYLAGRGNNEGGSIFDPVLCELAYSWFSPPGGTVLDPFAGGSVRGVVASRLGRQYIGVELREEQVAANRAQGDGLCSDPAPVWHTGDSRNIDRICADVEADFVFSCPPYADLEVYSDDPNDLSTLKYEEFKPAYFEIIAKACARLKETVSPALLLAMCATSAAIITTSSGIPSRHSRRRGCIITTRRSWSLPSGRCLSVSGGSLPAGASWARRTRTCWCLSRATARKPPRLAGLWRFIFPSLKQKQRPWQEL